MTLNMCQNSRCNRILNLTIAATDLDGHGAGGPPDDLCQMVRHQNPHDEEHGEPDDDGEPVFLSHLTASMRRIDTCVRP